MKITLKDGSVREVEQGISVIDLANSISAGLARMATAGKVNGKVVDLRYEINEDSEVEILTFESDLEGKKAYWHTTSHIMAQAVMHLFQIQNLQLDQQLMMVDSTMILILQKASMMKIKQRLKKK